MPSLYMINPKPEGVRADFEDGWVSSPDLAIVTVAAMAPSSWTVRVAEEAVQPVDLDSPADFIGLTGKSSQLEGIARLSRHFRARGKTVLVGGPLATLQPQAVREHADILVTGELEDMAPRLFADLQAGAWRDLYACGQADITRSPVPLWPLYPVQRAMSGALQTTRGCPFDCEFCDVIVYQGRKQRHKTAEQVLRELDALYAAGFPEVFLSDDNFAVHRRFARDMLRTISAWNTRQERRTRFYTQTSLDIARDADLLELCVSAGLDRLFVGIETSNEESLRETRKRQNLLLPILDAAERIVRSGVTMRSGLIVGFDHDGPTIFEELFAFFQAAPLPELIVGVLEPTFGTPLHARLLKEGRLRGDGRWHTMRPDACAFEPKLMSTQTLVDGVRDLAAALYAPDAFERRLLRAVDLLPPVEGNGGTAASQATRNERGRHVMSVLARIPRRGSAEKRMLARVLEAASAKPGALRLAITALAYFEQQRASLDLQSRSTAEAKELRPTERRRAMDVALVEAS